MKGEGCQHGQVRSYRILPSSWNPSPESRFVNRFDRPPTAGLFVKVSPKPTNHPKCSRPRCAVCSKSKNKAKGTHKLRSSDLVSVIDRSGLKFSGLSASWVLDHLASDHYLELDGGDDCVDEVYEEPCE